MLQLVVLDIINNILLYYYLLTLTSRLHIAHIDISHFCSLSPFGDIDQLQILHKQQQTFITLRKHNSITTYMSSKHDRLQMVISDSLLVLFWWGGFLGGREGGGSRGKGRGVGGGREEYHSQVDTAFQDIRCYMHHTWNQIAGPAALINLKNMFGLQKHSGQIVNRKLSVMLPWNTMVRTCTKRIRASISVSNI